MTEKRAYFGSRTLLIFTVVLALLACPILLLSQSPTPQTQQQKPPQQEAPPAAGGPQGDIGPIAIPKKKPEEEKPAPKPERIKNPEGLEDFSIKVNTQLVQVDVSVLTKDGQFIPGLKKENFRVIEDGAIQTIDRVEQTEAPITAVMLVEFASPNFMVNQQYGGSHLYDMLNASYVFAQSVKKEDWIGVISFDMKPTMLQDFTQDKRQVLQALNSMRLPQFSETNVFDALYDTIDRLEGIEGRKYIVLISGGLDTFSKLTLDKILDKIKTTRDITIYAIGTGQAFRTMYEQRMGSISSLNFLQADNQMKTFAKLTGGRAYFPRFVGEMPSIFQDVAQTIRNQYLISYKPTNSAQDGSFRKLKVELADAGGGPLVIQDQKGKKLKYQIIHREGYRAKQVVE